ncbi:MAG: hypothetical protein V2J55_16580 [Candidatus Competibacteraceae bacterium]|jgi:F-type H+-transporting ATPase subunit b|nr:hypothetical protein [Candidatus Competibacteraceae bacterium]
MQIDWITVSAQIINFLVLIYLLKRFLYRPVMDAMAKREQRIADRLLEAQQRESEASQAMQQFRDQQQAIEQQRDELLEQAQRDVEQQRQALMTEARQSVEQSRHQWQREIAREKGAFLKAIRRQTGHAVLRGLRRVLADMADSSLEERMAQVWVKRLNNLDNEAREQLISVLVGGSEPVQIITTFETTDAVRSLLAKTLSELAGTAVDVYFEPGLDAVCGVELQIGGWTLGWTLGEYLDEIESDLEQTWTTLEVHPEQTLA